MIKVWYNYLTRMRRTSKNPYNGLWGYTVAAPETSTSNVSPEDCLIFQTFFHPAFFILKKRGLFFYLTIC